MYPWLFFWAPQFHFPWSGNVAQRIDPNTTWFSDMISPAAGDAEVEKSAFQVASYGKQLGLITEVLIDLAEQQPPKSADGKQSLKRLKAIQSEIEQIKSERTTDLLKETQLNIETLRANKPEAYAELQRRLNLVELNPS